MPKTKYNNTRGFTLLEILLVIGIIAVLAGIVIVAINPSRQLKSVRDVERKTDIGEVNKAMSQFYIDHGFYPASSTLIDNLDTPTEICNTGSTPAPSGVDCDDLVDLSELVPTYIVSIPTDPQTADDAAGTGYKLAETTSKKVYVEASDTELSGTNGYVAYVGPIPEGYTPDSVGSGEEGGGGGGSCDSTCLALRSNLIAYYSFDTDASDENDGTYNGTISGADANPTCKVNGCYDFSNSSGDYIDIGAIPSFTGSDYSIGMWIKTSSTGHNAFITRNSGGGGYFFIGSGSTNVYANIHGCNAVPSTGLTLNNGSWHYLTMTYDQSTIRLYVDGSSAGTVSASSCSDQSANIRIGLDGTGSTAVKSIDEVGIWNVALSSGEVSSLYNSNNGRSLINN